MTTPTGGRPTDSDRWQQLEELFQHAADLPDSERLPWLHGACGADRELFDEVASLLEHAALAATGLPRAMGAVVGEIEGSAPSKADCGPDAGTLIGPFHLVKEIGRGGMGTVYLGFRTGDEFRQSVAIKLVSRGMDSDAILGRFRNERRILAALEHPNIARLFDGGSTPDGRPYFVMEYIQGLPVNEYCRRYAPDVPTRLQIFLDICAAVEHAHRRMVIHRDIKPSNILVLPDGTPKLLDFGIAKILDNPDSPEDEALTSTALRLLTPDYASPEQVRGEPVSAATDVYALGTVLFEMLSGSKAHSVGSRSQAEMERVICQEPTKPPSQALLLNHAKGQAKEQAELIRGDLDNIVLMAMRKEPERRYQSVADLAADIERHLEGRPVAARKDTFAYRASKFIRRNRLAVAASVVVAVSVAAGVASTIYQARRAERRFTQVRKLANKFLFGFDAEIAKVPGTTAAREMVVKTAQEYLDTLMPDSKGDLSLQASLGNAYRFIADIQGYPPEANLGHYREAVGNFRRAIQIQRPVVDARPDSLEDHFSLAIDLAHLSRLHLYLLELDPAQAAADQCLPLARKISEQAKGNYRYHVPLFEALALRGDILRARGDAVQALTVYRYLLAFETKAQPTEADFGAQLDLASARASVAEASSQVGEVSVARKYYLEAEAGLFPMAGQFHGDYGFELDKMLAQLYLQIGRQWQMWPVADADTKVALDYLSKSEAAARLQYEADTNDSGARFDLATSSIHLAAALAPVNPRRALEVYRRVPKLLAGMADSAPAWKLLSCQSAASEAEIFAAQHDIPRARARFESAIDCLGVASSAIPFLDNGELPGFHLRLGRILKSTDPHSAGTHLQTALSLAQRHPDSQFVWLALRAQILQALGDHAVDRRDSPFALQFYRQGRSLWVEWLKNHQPEDYTTLQLGKIEASIGRLSGANPRSPK